MGEQERVIVRGGALCRGAKDYAARGSVILRKGWLCSRTQEHVHGATQ